MKSGTPEHLAYYRQYRADHRETLRAQQRARFSGPDGRRLMKHYGLHSKYGITLEEWESLFDQQGRRCAICGTDTIPIGGRGNGWHTDHNHATGMVRGILCGKCNLGLGYMLDDPGTLRAAACYLEAHK